MRGQFRLVHIGVTAAVAAMVTAIGLVQFAGATGGTASVFVPIVPCRLADTRPAPDNVGPRATMLGAAEAVSFAVWGTNGNCTIPNTATGIATNVTAVHSTTESYVTIYPADASPRPTASNLNVVAGGAPTPNQVTVGLSAKGAIAAYNNGGSLDLVIDIVGYYQAAQTASGGVVNNDDRYYTKDQIDATIAGVNNAVASANGSVAGTNTALAQTNAVVATKQTKPTGTRKLILDISHFVPTSSTAAYSASTTRLSLTNNGCFVSPVDLPDGSKVTKIEVNLFENSAADGISAYYIAAKGDKAGTTNFLANFGTGIPDQPGLTTIEAVPSDGGVIDNQTWGYSTEFCGFANTSLYGIIITYTLP